MTEGMTHHQPSPLRGFAVTALMMTTAILVVGQLYAYLPFLAAIADRLSTTAGFVGLTTTVFALFQAAGLLVVGLLNRRIAGGRLFAAGMAGLAVVSAATAVALAVGNDYGFLAGRALQGLAAATFPPFAIAAVIENTVPRHRPMCVGLFSASLLMAAPLGQLVAAGINNVWSLEGILFASAVGLAPVAALLWLFRLTEARTPDNLFRVDAVRRLVHWRALGRVYMATFVLLLGVVFYYAAVESSGLGVDLQLFRLLGTPAVLMTLVAGAVLHRWPAPAVQATGFAASALGALITGLAGAGAGLHLGHWLMLGGIAFAVPAVLSFVGEQAAHHRQRAILFYTFILFAGASMGAPLLALLDDQPLAMKMILLVGIHAVAAVTVASYLLWPARLESSPDEPNHRHTG